MLLQTARMCAAGESAQCIGRSNYANAAYWTMAQLTTHHTVSGCSVNAGDLLGTGTLSGAAQKAAASLLKRSAGGKLPITVGSEQRTFLHDGDRVILRGRCERTGIRTIGFNERSATVLPAPPL